nr:hypothetical protein [Tanacetum cinerariifolium]
MDNPEHVDDDDEKDDEKVKEKEGCEMAKQFWKTHKQVNQVLHQGASQLAEKATDLKPCIATTIIEDSDAFCSEVLKHKFEKSSISKTSYRDDDIHSRHDDHQEDDAPPEGKRSENT